MTELFERPLARHELVKRELTVIAAERVAPDMVRVTLGGDDLAGFASDGPADHIKMFFPAEDGPAMRDFTPLHREDGLLDVDFYTHVNPGPAAAWALQAKPGDTVRIGGPRGSRGLPAGASAYLLIADETALPSASRWIAQAEVPVTLIAAVHGDGAWVASYVGLDEVTVVDPSAIVGALPEIDATTFVWASGEAGSLIPVRRHLRRELNLPKEQVAVDGYWRQGAENFDHHAPLDPADPED